MRAYGLRRCESWDDGHRKNLQYRGRSLGRSALVEGVKDHEDKTADYWLALDWCLCDYCRGDDDAYCAQWQ